ncbi:hypothetical protein GNI_008590 [Gregarina niphandrodes]|uniref:Uncharacterized protein n=1 Tax=Gregarina niphandrodes TaxID=110365 RepID=A0A023BD52_GRENI|nr:hypothetical protein GNI_008590 [Gregarina niphandrodes]EZG87026.1 hypothetical protein GNI_008590 [Gregarina niphandrodes]|eukprot:XP_011128718.1 hypothetical protein GNI_008590 [Gregarina niphandrodes]
MQSPKKEPAKEAAYQNYLAQEKELADAQRRAQEQEFAYKQKLNAQEAELIAMHAREAQKHRSSLQTEYRAAKEREESKRPNKREVGVLYQVNPQFTEDQLRAVRLHTGLSPPDMKPVIGDFGLVSQASALPVERIGGAQMQPGQIASLAHGPSPAQTGVSNAERSLLQACNPVEVDKVFTVWLRAIKEAAFNY